MKTYAHSQGLPLQILPEAPVSWQMYRKRGSSHRRLVWLLSYFWGAHLWWLIIVIFLNETVSLLMKALCTVHPFTLRYCPWSYGAAERLRHEIIHVARRFLSQLELRPSSRTDLFLIFSQSKKVPLSNMAQTLHLSLHLWEYCPLHASRHYVLTPHGNPLQSQKAF